MNAKEPGRISGADSADKESDILYFWSRGHWWRKDTCDSKVWIRLDQLNWTLFARTARQFVTFS